MNLQEELKALKERIAELEQLAKEEQEFPQYMDVYYYIQASGRVDNVHWSEDVTDFQIRGLGNTFRTKEEAEFAAEKLKVEAELRKFGKPFESMENNFHIVFDASDGSVDVWYVSYSKIQGAIYFESKKKAIEAIETVGEERIKKYIFEVED